MKIELDKLEPDKAQEFLNYFIAQIKEKNKTPYIGHASARYNDQGQYETLIYDYLKTSNDEEFMVEWTIVQNRDGTIPFIEINSLTGKDPNESKNSIDAFIKNVLLLTLAETKKEFFNRSYYCYIGSYNLKGEYWINSNLRIAPLFSEDNSFLPMTERVIVIDQNIKAIDSHHSRQLGDEQAIQLAAQLSFLLEIGLYYPRHEKRWFINTDPSTNEARNIRQLTGFNDLTLPPRMPKKGELCELCKPFNSIYQFGKSYYNDLLFPIETRKILKALEKTDHTLKLAFNRCCRLYQIAMSLGSYYPTIKFAYLYGAIDSICQTTKEYKGFSDFILAYFPEANPSIISFIHEKVRSSHWHSGQFILGEDESNSREFIIDRNQPIRNSMMIDGYKIIRTAILNWIYKKIIN